MRIGLIGGSFDPIHYGHLILAQQALINFKLDRVIFVPAGIPPHKLNLYLTPALHRFNMVKSAIKDNPDFSASNYEIKLNVVNYTYYTIQHFMKEYPHDRIFFILGPDLLSQLHTWENSEKLLKLCQFTAGINHKYSKAGISKSILGKVKTFEIPLLEISSTLIRKNINKGLPIKYFTPEAVERYILKNNLYKR